MLRLHVCRRLSDRLDGIAHGPDGSIDKLLMTSTEQVVGPRRARHRRRGPRRRPRHRAQGVPLQPRPERHGRHRTDPTQPRRPTHPGTAHHMSHYDLPDVIEIEVDGPIRIVRLNRPDDLNATNHELHHALADLFPQLDADDERARRGPDRQRPRVLRRRRLRVPRRADEGRGAPAADARRRQADRHRHGRVHGADRRRRQRPRRRSRLQPGRALRHRLHGAERAPRRPARRARPRGRRRRPDQLAAPDEPAAHQGVRPHRRPHPGRARRGDRPGEPRVRRRRRARRGDRVRAPDREAAAPGRRRTPCGS